MLPLAGVDHAPRARSGRFARRALAALVCVLTGFGLFASSAALAGLPGYAEWVLWRETGPPAWAEGEARGPALEWIVGPFSRRLDCERERDRLMEAPDGAPRQDGATRRLGSGVATIGGSAERAPSGPVRLFCVPDWVNPREDRRWR